MGIIYREVVRYKKISFLRGLFFVMLSILAANIIVNSWGYSTKYNIQIGILLFIGSVLLAMIIREAVGIVYLRRICYTYKLIDKELIFEKTLGKSKRTVFSVNTKDIESIAPGNKSKGIKGIDRTYRFLCDFSKEKAYCCVVNNKGKKIAIYIQPSDELVKKMNRIVQGASI